MVSRDRDTDANGSLDERLYALQDVNFNVTAIANTSGAVQEKYTETPFGVTTFRNSSGTVIGSSTKDWVFLHQGGQADIIGDLDFRNRVLSPSLGRWLSNDPLGFGGNDVNLARYNGNAPSVRLDPMGLAEYKKGADDPKINADGGAGRWGSMAAPADAKVLAGMIFLAVTHLRAILPNAADNLAHYFGNTGADHTIDLQSMINQAPSAKKLYWEEQNKAMDFCETLPNGIQEITSSKSSIGSISGAESKDWKLAIGGYNAWGKGKVTRDGDSFVLHFEYKFFDRYNWDKNRDPINLGAGLTVTNEDLAMFHQMGLAKEYNNYGSIKKTLIWQKGQAAIEYDGWIVPPKTLPPKTLPPKIPPVSPPKAPKFGLMD